ncbi:DUF6397 family protein [Streptomyces griseus]|uniref:DUF6397 family protein n=1 Tax=Streptomyces griseus TaxID=1911 RepID=UPI000AFD060F|nr:DUF6397 family protein [Streptomyces griseus]
MATREVTRARTADGRRGRAETRDGTRRAGDAGPVGGADEAGGAGPADPPVPKAVARGSSLSSVRAAQELELKRGEFELALHLGLIDAESAPEGRRPRVRREEIDRLRATPGFPAALRDRVRTAGTAEGAALLGISPVRFTGLARIGCVSPVAFYLNRYRAVVWLYLVDELLAFAEKEPELLAGRSPAGMRVMLEAGTDWRARNWRARRIDRLLSRSQDPWVRAALQASALDPVQLAEMVDDPYERAYLARVLPYLAGGRPVSVPGREAMGQLMLADDPDEILWRRVNLSMELDLAREIRPAPRPGAGTAFRAAPTTVGAAGRGDRGTGSPPGASSSFPGAPEGVRSLPGASVVPSRVRRGWLARIGLGG